MIFTVKEPFGLFGIVGITTRNNVAVIVRRSRLKMSLKLEDGFIESLAIEMFLLSVYSCSACSQWRDKRTGRIRPATIRPLEWINKCGRSSRYEDAQECWSRRT